ncbi:hypothetical protein [Phaeobacter sp. HF9A]|uniref:hypothetical protein n=1 Tax=Phaeobacter sp. HF9A TaxID=2721561 RepID=UPI0014303B1D|nr:hypothetical protein [Phaeobacter sp. HF9A]NIZ15662.1 hypothetical protein [Phaeobacter sp. HF9A]
MTKFSLLLAALSILPLASCAPSYVQKGRTQAVSYPLPPAGSASAHCTGEKERHAGAYRDALLGLC